MSDMPLFFLEDSYKKNITPFMAVMMVAQEARFVNSQAIDGAHMALGITTEIGEMQEGIEAKDHVNVREEHGDCNWYIANECNIYSFNFEHLYRAAQKRLLEPKFRLHEIVDLHKKELAYGKEMDENELQNQLITLIQYLIAAYHCFHQY